MKKRGQVAIFALLGLVMLIIVSFLLLITASVTTVELQERAREAVRDYLAASPVNYYVNLCLEQATKEAIVEMGKQGGVFWDYQQGPYEAREEGTTHITWDIDGTPYNISYGIVRFGQNVQEFINTDGCSIVNTDPPLYPRVNTKISDLTLSNYFATRGPGEPRPCTPDNYSAGGFLGVNVLPRLCYRGSVNTRDLLFTGPDGGARAINICAGRQISNWHVSKNLTMEYLLNQRILNKTLECIDFKLFEDMDGDNVSLIEGEGVENNVSIVYGSEEFSSILTLPFRVALRGHVPVITSYSFEYTSNVRLRELHQYVFELLKEDAVYPTFNITEQYDLIGSGGTSYFRDGFEVEIKEFDIVDTMETNDYRWDRILKVTDTKSQIFGQNFTYYAVIQNRPPVLDYIDESPHPFLNYIVFEDDYIEINPLGYDPDGRNIFYTYSGWRETVGSILNEECLSALTEVNVSAIKGCMDPVFCGDNCNEWTLSQLYVDNAPNARLRVNSSHLGYHRVRLQVTEESNRFDYQDVSILVIDNPELNLNITPVYDFGFDVLTFENPIRFDASESTAPKVVGGEFTRGEFSFYDEDGKHIVSYTVPPSLVLNLPNSAFDIGNISALFPDRKGLYSLTVRLYFGLDAEFQGLPISSVTQTYPFQVLECVPHRNENSPAYPYHDSWTTEPFFANHTCCEDNLEPNRDGKICYAETVYSSYQTVYRRANELFQAGAESINQAQIHPSVSGNWQTLTIFPHQRNDIWQLNFERECDGTRGNICAGDMTIDLTNVRSCDYNESLILQCSGPLVNTYYDSAPNCYNYKDWQGLNTTSGQQVGNPFINSQGPLVLCTNTGARSTRADDGYGELGPLWCEGAGCDGKGGCKDTRRVQCSCQYFDDSLGAKCSTDTNSTWTETTCKFDCETYESCSYRFEDDMPCRPDQLDQNTGSCYVSNTCYTAVQCTRDGSRYQSEDCRQYFESNNVCNVFDSSDPCTSDGCKYIEYQMPGPNPEDWECGPSGWTER